MAKYNLGCGPLPIHPQHYSVMINPDEWTLVDKYIDDPQIENWDATDLSQIADNFAEEIYSSHLLEHISHTRLQEVLALWYRKLVGGGRLTVNVPDLVWACERLLKMENGQLVEGDFSTWLGERNVWEIFYGTHSHEGEHHGAGFTESFLRDLLEKVGFRNVVIKKEMEAHNMRCLIATAIK